MSIVVYEHMVKWLSKHGPRELHCVGTKWNRDLGTAVLLWIVNHPKCDRGTALTLFWFGSPKYFLKYKDRESVAAKDRSNIDTFDLLWTILQNWHAGRYKSAEISTEDIVATAIEEYARAEMEIGKVDLPWLLPDDMRKDIEGQVWGCSGYIEGYPSSLRSVFRRAGIPH